MTKAKQEKVRGHAKSLMRMMARGRGWVRRDSFCLLVRLATSLTCASSDFFNTRSLPDVLSEYFEARNPYTRRGTRVRFPNSSSHREKKDLRDLAKQGERGGCSSKKSRNGVARGQGRAGLGERVGQDKGVRARGLLEHGGSGMWRIGRRT